MTTEAVARPATKPAEQPGAPTLEVERGLVMAGRLVIGMDEVGRGAIAGPVAVGAVAADVWSIEPLPGVRDSKLLTQRRREALADGVRVWGSARAVGLASAAEVDAQGIIAALGLAARRALVVLHDAGIPILESTVLLDGSHDWLSPVLRNRPRIVTRVKADRDCAVVATASVLAKVERDGLMIAADAVHPGYGWSGNKGYGSAGHFAAIRELGASPLHRVTWLHD